MKMADINQDANSVVFACSEVMKLLPKDLLPYLTVLFQDSGYVTISTGGLMRRDWIRINNRVRRLGGIWVSNSRYSRWSTPFSARVH